MSERRLSALLNLVACSALALFVSRAAGVSFGVAIAGVLGAVWLYQGRLE